MVEPKFVSQKFKNFKTCGELAKEITKIRNELKKRISEMQEDPYQLKEKGPMSINMQTKLNI